VAVETSIVPAAGWAELLAGLGRGTILVVGAPGTGKTALARYLVGQLDRVLPRVALVDCDSGRPAIGVPGCLGLALTAPWEAPAALWFVGGTAPAEHPLPAVVGAARLAERARAAGAAAVVLDTPGRVGDAAGRALLYHLAQATAADQVVAIERAGELAPLLTLLEREGRAVHRLAPSAAARPCTAGEEESHREGRLRAHLYDAAVRLFGAGRLVLDWAAGPWSGNGHGAAAGNGHGASGNGHVPGAATGRDRSASPESGAAGPDGDGPAARLPLAGTVVGLLDGGGFCLGLGRLQALHDDRVEIATRVTRGDVAGLRVGGFRVAEDGSPL
jgi:polynucleotide 5'-kinase involved in rRNA processing